MKKNVTKVLAVVAAVAMVSMTSVSAFAADTNTTSGTTTVKYDVTEAYTWSVPTEINFTNVATSNNLATVTTNGTSGSTQNVQVTKNVIANKKMLRISLDSSNTFKIKSGEDAELSYAVRVKADENSNATAIGAGGTVLDVKAGSNTGSAVLVFTLTKDTVEKAGNYTGNLTYTSEVVADTVATVTGTTTSINE